MIRTLEHGNVRELRLERPPVNALNRALLLELDAALVAAGRDEVRAVVLGGLPGMFSAGLDVAELASSTPEQIADCTRIFFALQRRLATSPVPLVAAIGGHSPAGGTVLAMFCDYRIMASGAFRIGLNEVQVGLFAGRRIFRAYAWLLGEGRAAGLLARGAMLEAKRAWEIGLVDEIADPEQTLPRALAVAAEFASLPPRTLARTREMTRAGLVAALDVADELADAPGPQPEWITDETRASFAKILNRRR